VAIFHLNAKIVSRAKGQSAVAKAAYNAHDLLTNENTAERHDYRYKGEVLFSGIFTPKYAPDWVQEVTKDRAALWSAVEKAETRKNSQLAREIEIALPYELTDKQREYLVKDFVRENFVRHGMIADVAIHKPAPKGDQRNHHAHILLTMRELGPDGFAAKMREFDSKAQLTEWREKWEHLANRCLERFGHAVRIDHRTLEAQGINREPTSHVGPTATDFERDGVKTARGDINREIEERNRQRMQLNAEKKEVMRDLANEYKALTANQIRGAWTASNDGLDFMMALNERGLCIAEAGKGRYAAVARNGFAHHLDQITYAQDAPKMRAAIETVRRDCDGLIIPSIDEMRTEIAERRELKKKQCAAHLGATLYDRADMVSMQHDAMRHLKDAHRLQHQNAKANSTIQAKSPEQEIDTIRRDFWQEIRELGVDQAEQAREEKRDRTEQTESKQRKATREAMREQFENSSRSSQNPPSSNEEEGRERERER